MTQAPANADDVFYGMPAIAQAFGWRTRQAEHLKEAHGLPTFKVGKTVCARRGAIADWLREREAAGREGMGAGSHQAWGGRRLNAATAREPTQNSRWP